MTGVSGTGIVADAVEYTDGTVAVHWAGKYPSTVVWPEIASVMAVNGHGGATLVEAIAIICPVCRQVSVRPGDIASGWCAICGVATSGPWGGDGERLL